MSMKTILSAMIIGLASCGANAEPQAFPITSFSIDQIDPSLPALQLIFNSFYFGPGSGRYDFAPAIIEQGVGYQDFPPPTSYWVEVARLGTPLSDPYPMIGGDIIEDALGSWVHPIRDFDTSGGVLFFAYSERSGDDFDCWTCGGTEVLYLPSGEIRYLPFRWQAIEGGDWYYGWIAMRGTVTDRPNCTNPCNTSQGTADRVRFRYIGIGVETSSNTPIVAGGGLCPADFTFDAVLDFFDISAFLSLYADGDAAADMNGDGAIDFFDISMFLGYFTDECEL